MQEMFEILCCLDHVGSMIEFKQIIGRGTRLFEQKDYFTIYDFEDVYLKFFDEEWDGEPIDPDPLLFEVQ